MAPIPKVDRNAEFQLQAISPENLPKGLDKKYLQERKKWDKVKVVLIGEDGVGKTSLVHYLASKVFEEESRNIPTVYRNVSITYPTRAYDKKEHDEGQNSDDDSNSDSGKVLEKGDKGLWITPVVSHLANSKCNVEFWDTADKEEDYTKLRPMAYPLTHVFLACFSVASKETFTGLKKYVNEVMDKHSDARFVVVGLQKDLRKESDAHSDVAKKKKTTTTTPAKRERKAKEGDEDAGADEKDNLRESDSSEEDEDYDPVSIEEGEQMAEDLAEKAGLGDGLYIELSLKDISGKEVVTFLDDVVSYAIDPELIFKRKQQEDPSFKRRKKKKDTSSCKCNIL